MKNVFIIANTSWYVYNFRATLIKKIQSLGYRVIVMAPVDDYSVKIQNLGAYHFPITMNRKGRNPFQELKVIINFFIKFKSEKPCIVLTYTPKVNIYASIASHLLNIPVINNISGLGASFVTNNITKIFVTALYKFALFKSKKVFFQNFDDLKYFTSKKLVSADLVERIPGSGVDVDRFHPVDAKVNSGKFVFLCVARLLWDKGIGELVEAMRILKPHYQHIECQILGFIDDGNPSAIPEKTLHEWNEEGVIKYLGSTDNVFDYIINADCIVLPSYYREGVPRCLLEAASMAKPIITTNSVGCKDAVDDGVTGYLCRTKDPFDLANKMKKMINLPSDEISFMGYSGRLKMIEEFNELIVIEKYIIEIEKYCAGVRM